MIANTAKAASGVLFAFALALAITGAEIHERPNLGANLVCVDSAGRPTAGEDWKECHRPRTLWEVAALGW